MPARSPGQKWRKTDYEDEESIKEKALSSDNVKKHIDGKTVVKIIVIKGRIVNIVVK